MKVKITSRDMALSANQVFEVFSVIESSSWPQGLYLIKLADSYPKNESTFYPGMWGKVTDRFSVSYLKDNNPDNSRLSEEHHSSYRWFDGREVEVLAIESNEEGADHLPKWEDDDLKMLL